MKKQLLLYFLSCIILSISISAQSNKRFTFVKQIKTTSVKDQAMSGTCWSFATTSFIESELMRMGKGELNISEMFFVRNAYNAKIANYIRMQGNLFYTQGGQPHDVMNVVRNFGLVPDSLYSGLLNNQTTINHFTLDSLINKIIVTLKDINDADFLKTQLAAFNQTCDKYLGKLPKTFIYKGKNITPKTYADSILKFNPDDYIEITSYNHHHYYSSFCLESRFNWSFAPYYNLPLTEFMQVIDSAIYHGYSVVWNGDVSETTFDFYGGTATAGIYEGKVNQKNRQETFENTSTKVDHVMHLTGIAKDEKGAKYYCVKNSWGTDNPYGGSVFLSESYVKLKTVSILVFKQAIPNGILRKMK